MKTTTQLRLRKMLQLLLLLPITSLLSSSRNRSSTTNALQLFGSSSILPRREVIEAAAAALALTTTTTATSTFLPNGMEERLTNIANTLSQARPATYNPETIELRAAPSSKNRISMPTIGYSFYKTKDKIDECVKLALFSGKVEMLDLASQYGTNAEVGESLKTIGLTSADFPKSLRKLVFLHHKISNADQDLDVEVVKKNVKREIAKLADYQDRDKAYLDICSIHSPLTDKERRLASYRALLELQKEGLVKAVGVCNYGVGALNEIIEAGLPAPAINQLELSPFNQHKDVIQWATDHDMEISCAAWSKLSSVNGPQDGWAILADIAKKKEATKAQILVRWALQKGYNCVPRSSANSKIEKFAIVENSLKGVKRIEHLTEEEMNILDGLDEQLKAGHLGRRDGWEDSDVTGDRWDPTEFV